jgi:Ni/Co efflux regulator RcnB
MEEGHMRRLLALIAVVALMVAFALPMAGTAEAASHGDKAMNPCEKAKAKEMQKANPCGQTANPCGMKDKSEKTMEKGKETTDKGQETMKEGKGTMDKTKSQ